jgi:hypothetical protein
MSVQLRKEPVPAVAGAFADTTFKDRFARIADPADTGYGFAQQIAPLDAPRGARVPSRLRHGTPDGRLAKVGDAMPHLASLAIDAVVSAVTAK